jgi:colanic acid biosynthesis glycosyl transferase WcaI
LEEQLAAKALGNVLLLPYQPRSRVPELYAAADVCLVPLKPGTAQKTFPSKIYTIMAAGRPVIAAADKDSELTWLVEHAECGWSVPPDDVGALMDAITTAYTQRAQLPVLGSNGRAYVVDNHSRQAVAQRYATLICKLTGEPWRAAPESGTEWMYG